MATHDLTDVLTVGLLFAVLELFRLVLARPFLFLSLGPSAYLFATPGDDEETSSDPSRVIGGTLIGIVCGLIGHYTFAYGVEITAVLNSDPTAFATPRVHLSASSIAAIVLRALGMLRTDTSYPPACATALIVSLGILTTALEAIYRTRRRVAVRSIRVHHLPSCDRARLRTRGTGLNSLQERDYHSEALSHSSSPLPMFSDR